MDIQPETPCDSTPDVSARIVTAIGRIATVLRAGMWEVPTAEGLDPAQAEILHLPQHRTRGVRLSRLAKQLSIPAASASDSVAALRSRSCASTAPNTGRPTRWCGSATGRLRLIFVRSGASRNKSQRSCSGSLATFARAPV